MTPGSLVNIPVGALVRDSITTEADVIDRLRSSCRTGTPWQTVRRVAQNAPVYSSMSAMREREEGDA
jgi:hypothetical protein